jgi:hypothetical protein
MANTDTLASFLDILNNPGNGHYQNADYLVDNYFCGDSPSKQNPAIPCVGITDHGPAFFGTDDVKLLFGQLFTTFKNLRWQVPPQTVPNAPQLVATNYIGVQMTVKGQYKKAWFQPPTDGSTDHSSAPLTQLGDNANGGSLGKYRGDGNGLPAFAVFTFNAGFLIQQLQVYMDRYAMMMSLTKAQWNPEASPAITPIHGPLPLVGTRGGRTTITIDN